MSKTEIKKNPASMSAIRDAYTTLTDSLTSPPLALDVNAIAQAYGTTSGAGLDTMAAKLAAAEVMIRAGTNVVTLSDTGWDTHGDTTERRCAIRCRASFRRSKVPASHAQRGRPCCDEHLRDHHGDFARDLPSGDHAPALSALVIGPNVKVGTTGKVSDKVTLPDGTGASREMWSYLAALAKVATKPVRRQPARARAVSRAGLRGPGDYASVVTSAVSVSAEDVDTPLRSGLAYMSTLSRVRALITNTYWRRPSR